MCEPSSDSLFQSANTQQKCPTSPHPNKMRGKRQFKLCTIKGQIDHLVVRGWRREISEGATVKARGVFGLFFRSIVRQERTSHTAGQCLLLSCLCRTPAPPTHFASARYTLPFPIHPPLAIRTFLHFGQRTPV
ncbi:hypothetical protein EYB25_003233 [Talaromyces marneffei]|nr:hypothetical protein EYB25_003233 [Talaromyces marneffei]